MRHTTKLLVIIATAVSTVAFAGAGWAYWATTGTGTDSAAVGTLAAPSGITVPGTSSGTVAVSWTASSTSSPNVAPTGYYVQRFGGTPSPAQACNTSPSNLTIAGAISCNDTGVTDGTYTYKVTAVFRSWTAQSLPSGSVTVSTDTTAPTLVAGSLQMFDTNGNGKVDQVKATFSETLGSYTAGTTPWTLTSVPSGGTLSSVSVTGADATLAITEGANPANTAVGSFTVALATNANGIRDAAGNQSSFAGTAPADKAAPAFVSITNGTGGTNGNGKLEANDFLDFGFSEPLAWTPPTSPAPVVTLTGGNGSNTDQIRIGGLTNIFNTASPDYIAGNNKVATFPNLSTLTLINAGATVRVTLGSCSGDCGTAITAAGTTSGSGTFVSGIADAASNAASTFTWSAFKFF